MARPQLPAGYGAQANPTDDSLPQLKQIDLEIGGRKGAQLVCEGIYAPAISS